MKKIFLLLSICFITAIQAQEDEKVLKDIYTTALTKGQAYSWLDHLSNVIGPRLTGSFNAELAVKYTKEEMEKLGFDKVWLQPVMVPKWVRGIEEHAYIEINGIRTTVPICALGGSIGTSAFGVKANVVEVKSIEELKQLGAEKVRGKIVFFNRPMEAHLINTFEAYGGCVDQRVFGAKEAAEFEALGVIVRSMNLKNDDYPHTGSMYYSDNPDVEKIPAAAISTNAANQLSKFLKINPDLQFFFRQSCEIRPDVQSYNVIGEIKGSQHPDKIMVVGGHLDSWDLGDGSHDDGAGCVQSMEALRLLQAVNYKPKHTIRVVLFMNEENGLRGATKYAAEATKKKENHIFALESDSGGFTPRGFTFECDDENFTQILSWESLFDPYLIHYFKKGGSGADVHPLKNDANVVAGLRPDSQRYFDYHHAATDTFDAVNERELHLGAATMASLLYLFDTYGVK